jgi:hypothetical protein
MPTKRDFLRSAALATITATAASSSQAWAEWSERPGFFKAKDIAEAGFIYGLPMVMAYGVMNEYAVDKSSGQYKAPFNTLYNDARVFTYEDTAVVTPNSDTSYSFAWASTHPSKEIAAPRRVGAKSLAQRTIFTAPKGD